MLSCPVDVPRARSAFACIKMGGQGASALDPTRRVLSRPVFEITAPGATRSSRRPSRKQHAPPSSPPSPPSPFCPVAYEQLRRKMRKRSLGVNAVCVPNVLIVTTKSDTRGTKP